MGTRGTGRRRSMKKEKTTAEEDALSLMSAQAKTKLEAKKAARAEAREIRLQELERQQRGVQDKDYSDDGSPSPFVSPSPSGGTSCKLGDGDTCVGNESSSQNNEIMLAEVEEKYRKAMVSIAQLDNEKNQLMYVVDVLKDSLLELEELLSETRREYEDKVKEHEQEKHAHHLLMLQFREMKDSLKQHQELLHELQRLHNKPAAFVLDMSDLHETPEWKDKKIQAVEPQKEFAEENRPECNQLKEETHGIMLKPNLSINDSAGAPAMVGSVDVEWRPEDGGELGSTAETELRRCREEDVDPQHLKEEPEHLWSSEALQKHVDASALPEEPYFLAEEVCSVESSLRVDLTVVEISPLPQETNTTEDGDAPQTEVWSSVNTCDIEKKEMSRIIKEEQKAKQSHVQKHHSKPRPELNTEEALQSLPTDSHSEQKTEELNSGEQMEETPNKSQITTLGKKKKKKRGKKKKGGTHDDKNQQKTRAGKEAGTNKKLEEEADVKDLNTVKKPQTEDEEESGTTDASAMIKSRFPKKTLQETSVYHGSGEAEKTPGDEGATTTFLKDNKSGDEEKTEGTFAIAGQLAEGSLQIDLLKEPTTDPMFVDVENLTLEMEMVNKEEPGVRTKLEASCHDKEETPGSLSGADTSELNPAVEILETDGEKSTESDGDSAELDLPPHTEDVCASSASDLEWSQNGTCHEMGTETIPGGAEALEPADSPEMEEKSATSEPRLKNDQHDLECESSPSHLDKEQSKSCGGKPEEEGGEDEGQSFDFDDTELKPAAEHNPSKDLEWGESVEVTSAEINELKLFQSHPEEETRQNNLSESNGFRETQSYTVGQEKQSSSLSCEATPEKLENTSKKQRSQADESMKVAETQQRHAESTKEPTGSADGKGQTGSSAAETDVDPVGLKDKDLPKLSEEADGSSEALLEGKEAKKSSRKGKEECKMS